MVKILFSVAHYRFPSRFSLCHILLLKLSVIWILYIVIFRGLFEKDKLVFSFMICAEIMKQAKEISDAEWNFYLRGSGSMDKVPILYIH